MTKTPAMPWHDPRTIRVVFEDEVASNEVFFDRALGDFYVNLLAEVFARPGSFLLAGVPGTGKTTLLQRLSRDLRFMGCQVLWLDAAHAGSADERTAAFLPFGMPGDDGWGERVRDAAVAGEAKATPLILIVDGWDRVRAEFAALFALLLAGGMEGKFPLRIVIGGTPETLDPLSRLAASFPDHCSTLRKVEPLQPNAVGDYIRHRLRPLACHPTQVFSVDAIGIIAEKSRGVPRKINDICAKALSIAAASATPIVDVRIVEQACERLGGFSTVAQPAASNRRAALQKADVRAAPVAEPVATTGAQAVYKNGHTTTDETSDVRSPRIGSGRPRRVARPSRTPPRSARRRMAWAAGIVLCLGLVSAAKTSIPLPFLEQTSSWGWDWLGDLSNQAASLDDATVASPAKGEAAIADPRSPSDRADGADVVERFAKAEVEPARTLMATAVIAAKPELTETARRDGTISAPLRPDDEPIVDTEALGTADEESAQSSRSNDIAAGVGALDGASAEKRSNGTAIAFGQAGPALSEPHPRAGSTTAPITGLNGPAPTEGTPPGAVSLQGSSASDNAPDRRRGADPAKEDGSGSSAAIEPPFSTTARSRAETAEIFLERGHRMLAAKDIVAARLFYERAAEWGSAQAASAVGRTYDPEYLRRARIRGLGADQEKAIVWYKKAVELGDEGARERLDGMIARNLDSNDQTTREHRLNDPKTLK